MPTAIKDQQAGQPAPAEQPAAEIDPFDAFHSSPDGLTSDDAKARLEQHGYNEISEHRDSLVVRLLKEFWGPIPWMIEIAAILSAVVGHWPDFIIIILLLIANVAVGFLEQYQAKNAIDALKKSLALRARVRRDGQWNVIEARKLVPGDVVRLGFGDIIPADATIADDNAIEVDESALTGESLPVSRAKGDGVYSGSIVKQGECVAVVCATGSETYFGKTAQLVEEGGSVSHFQRAVLRIGDYLIMIAIALVMVILLVALFRGDRLLTTLQFALVLTVAAIPVAMPTVLSVTMAVGARILARSKAIVSRLAAIEELAGVDVLCSDKTGTLTQNQLTLGDPYLRPGVARGDLLLAAALASRAQDQQVIDDAILAAIEDPARLNSFRVESYQPFDPVRKRTEAQITDDHGRSFAVTKGAPQVILALAQDADHIRADVESAINEFAARGFRSLGVAQADSAGGEWKFLGIIPMYDPPREDSAKVLKAAAEMGLNVKMVTGDQLAIAREIAAQVGMGTNIVDSSEFEQPKNHQRSQIDNHIEDADGFAQVFPEHKYHIVDVLQRRGHIVGMTGDGVNDAPALKKADCGIAVSGATDAARSAASIVLTTPGLSVIIDAIRESRKIFQRMTSYATYRIAETIRVLLFMTLSILVFNFYPVTAIMIVLLAILNDGAILSIAYDRVRYSKKPERWNMREVLGIATVLGIAGVMASFLLFYLAEQIFKVDRETIRSLMYLKLSVAGHMTIFLTRTRGRFWSFRPAPILLIAVIGTQCLATLIAVYGIFMPPIGWLAAGCVWAFAWGEFIVADQLKVWAYRLFEPIAPSSFTD